jgi:glycosyltransferase involved in cell wall biosynthesis
MEYPKISVLVPVYNEEKYIDEVIKKILAQKKNFNIEIIIVDDCSKDKTKEILKNYENFNDIKIFYKDKNEGKGSAIKKAIHISTSDICIIQDADLEYNPEDFKNLLLPFVEANADAVYGSRFLGGGKYVRIHFFWHYLANKILTTLTNIVTNINLTDMETGYKAFRASKIRNLEIEEKSFGFEPEITIKLAQKKIKFYEVAISYNGRSYEEGKKITLKDAFKAIYCIFKYGVIKRFF